MWLCHLKVNLTAGTGVAVREFILEQGHGRADYLLFVSGEAVGAIVIYRLLEQKHGFTALDHELFNMLGGHAATAIFASRLYSQSERKLNTIQGFIDLLTK